MSAPVKRYCYIVAEPPLSVDDDQEFEGVDLPAALMVPTLDSDQGCAVAASAALDGVERLVTDVLWRLELAERALRVAEPHSQRARRARGHLRRALAGFETGVLSGLDHARLTLTNDLP